MKPNIFFTKLNAELFQFLAEPLPYKTSRFDAFRYLYECQTDNFDDTTYKQLAIEWGWERKAVISFLRSLQKMGIVEVKRKYRIIYIHILNLACIETEETENDSG